MKFLSENNNQNNSSDENDSTDYFLAHAKIKNNHLDKKMLDKNIESTTDDFHNPIIPKWKRFKSKIKTLALKIFIYKEKNYEKYTDNINKEKKEEDLESEYEFYTNKKKEKKRKKNRYKYNKKKEKLKFRVISSLIYLRRIRLIQRKRNLKILKKLNNLLTVYKLNLIQKNNQKSIDASKNLNKEQLKDKSTLGVKETQIKNQKTILNKNIGNLSIKSDQQNKEQLNNRKSPQVQKSNVQHVTINDRRVLRNETNLQNIVVPYLKIPKLLFTASFKLFSLLTVNTVRKIAITTTYTFDTATQFINHHNKLTTPTIVGTEITPPTMVIVLTTTFHDKSKSLENTNTQKPPSSSISASMQIDAAKNTCNRTM